MSSKTDQNNRLRYEIIHLTVQSKRLLADHIEILEDYMELRQVTDPGNTNKCLWKACSSLAAALALSGYALKSSGQKYAGILGGLGLGLVSAWQWTDCYRHWRDIKTFSELLDNLTNYHNVLKRNLNYLTDISHLNGPDQISERDRELANSSAQSCKALILILHKIVILYDSDHPITKDLVSYQQFEDLDMDSFCQSGTCTYKTIYTIFLYIQSQFVLRMAIAKAEGIPFVNEEMKRLIRELQMQLCRDDLRISVRKSETTQVGKPSSLLGNNPSNSRMKLLKWTTTNLSTKLILQSNQFDLVQEKLQKLDEMDSISNKTRKDLLELNEQLSNLESLFVASACEFEHVQLLLRKMLNIKEDESLERSKKIPTTLEDSQDSTQLKVVDQSTTINIDDEFFILDGQMAERESRNNQVPEEDSRNERVLKSSFKPVLKQLRKQIDPLNEEMLQRERKYLQLQGTELPEEVIKPPTSGLYGSCSSTGSEDEELGDDLILRKKKVLHPKPSKYDENRKFLEEKCQSAGIGLFRLPMPVNLCSEEDVLE